MASIHLTLLLHLAFVCVRVHPACPRFTNEINSRSERSVSKSRLPTSTIPIHYNLEIQPFPNNDTFLGMVTIIFQADSKTTNITLHAAQLHIQEPLLMPHKDSKIGTQNGFAVPRINRLRREDESQQLIIELSSEGLTAGMDYELSMRFTGEFSSDMLGLYKATYKDINGTERFIILSQLEATYARRVFPCFDEPAKKATFNLTIIRPVNMTSLSNTRRVTSVERGAEWMADTYETTLKMSTYLLGIVICDYEYLEDSSTSSAMIRVWTSRDLLHQANYSLEVAPLVLNFFEDFFNISYAPPKLDLVQIPDFQLSGMENWGLITLHDNAFLFDTIRSSIKYQQLLALLISHEISHQWFGNLVTMKWWSDLWLKEGFANYMMYLGVEAVEPSWKIGDQFTVTTLEKALEMDAWNGTHPISTTVDEIDKIASQFDAISYSKGASLIRMMDHFLSRDIFRSGIQMYLKDLEFGTATVEDLWHHLNIATKNCSDLNDTDVKIIMESWMLQSGYPVVTLTRNYNLQTANLTQMRFSFNTRVQNDGTQWHIPVTITTGDVQNFENTFAKKWLNPKSNGLELTQADGLPSAEVWVIVNIQRTAFYRVNYDTYNWNLLIQQLKSDHKQIHPINRAQLLDDILNLARAGYQNYHLALSATKYLEKETDYLPWHVAFLAADYIDSMLKYTHLYAKWKTYVGELIKNIYTKLSFFEYNEDHHLRKLTRNEVIKQACYYEEKDCIDNAIKVFKLWMDSNGTALIAGNIIETTVCATMRHGLAHQWEFAWRQFLNSNHSPQKQSILVGLGCTRDPWLLTRLVNRCLAGKHGITTHMARAVIDNIGKYNSLSRYILFPLLRDNWSTVKKYNSVSMTLDEIVKALTYTMNTAEDFKMLRSFIVEDKKPGVATRSYTLAMETVEANIQWLNNNLEPIGMWLDKNIL